MVKFVSAVAYHSCLSLPAAFTQPGRSLLAEPCSITTCQLQGLSTAQYRKVMLVVEQAILSTDLALYFRKKDIFLETANAGEIDWQEKEKKDCE